MIAIDSHNYELYLLRYAEGELDDTDRREVEQWLATHPKEAAELALYTEAPRLIDDTPLVYSRPIPKQTRHIWPVALRWTAVAAVVAAVVLPLVLREGDTTISQTSPMIAQAETPTVAPSDEEPMPDPATPSALPADRPVVISDAVVSAQPSLQEPFNSAIPLFEDEPLLAKVEDSVPADHPQLVYVDNLLFQDTLTTMEQQLVALNDEVRRSLDKGYLGRRMSRQLPSDEEVVASVRNVRSRMPYPLHYIGDMISTHASMNE